DRVVSPEDGLLRRFLHSAARRASAAALRPADGVRLEGDVADRPAQRRGNRRRPSGRLIRGWGRYAQSTAHALVHLPPSLPPPGDHPVPGAEALSRAALSWPHHSLTRSRRAGALRRLLPLRGRLSRRLHLPSEDTGRKRPLVSGVLSHQLLP